MIDVGSTFSQPTSAKVSPAYSRVQGRNQQSSLRPRSRKGTSVGSFPTDIVLNNIKVNTHVHRVTELVELFLLSTVSSLSSLGLSNSNSNSKFLVKYKDFTEASI